jgi:hypothetical protein
MKFRKLRIAWVLCGVTCVLLIVLWASSLNHIYKAYARIYDQYIEVSALRGRFGLQFVTERHNWTMHDRLGLFRKAVDSTYSQSYPVDVAATLGFSFQHFYPPGANSSLQVWRGTVPCWFLIAVCCGLAPLSFIPSRFSLRTLLIATTLVAVALGLAVYVARQ